MDNSNVLEMGKILIVWFVCVLLLKSEGGLRGGAKCPISQHSEDQVRDKIVNLTWIKITARLNIN